MSMVPGGAKVMLEGHQPQEGEETGARQIQATEQHWSGHLLPRLTSLEIREHLKAQEQSSRRSQHNRLTRQQRSRCSQQQQYVLGSPSSSAASPSAHPPPATDQVQQQQARLQLQNGGDGAIRREHSSAPVPLVDYLEAQLRVASASSPVAGTSQNLPHAQPVAFDLQQREQAEQQRRGPDQRATRLKCVTTYPDHMTVAPSPSGSSMVSGLNGVTQPHEANTMDTNDMMLESMLGDALNRAAGRAAMPGVRSLQPSPTPASAFLYDTSVLSAEASGAAALSGARTASSLVCRSSPATCPSSTGPAQVQMLSAKELEEYSASHCSHTKSSCPLPGVADPSHRLLLQREQPQLEAEEVKGEGVILLNDVLLTAAQLHDLASGNVQNLQQPAPTAPADADAEAREASKRHEAQPVEGLGHSFSSALQPVRDESRPAGCGQSSLLSWHLRHKHQAASGAGTAQLHAASAEHAQRLDGAGSNPNGSLAAVAAACQRWRQHASEGDSDGEQRMGRVARIPSMFSTAFDKLSSCAADTAASLRAGLRVTRTVARAHPVVLMWPLLVLVLGITMGILGVEQSCGDLVAHNKEMARMIIAEKAQSLDVFLADATTSAINAVDIITESWPEGASRVLHHIDSLINAFQVPVPYTSIVATVIAPAGSTSVVHPSSAAAVLKGVNPMCGQPTGNPDCAVQWGSMVAQLLTAPDFTAAQGTCMYAEPFETPLTDDDGGNDAHTTGRTVLPVVFPILIDGVTTPAAYAASGINCTSCWDPASGRLVWGSAAVLLEMDEMDLTHTVSLHKELGTMYPSSYRLLVQSRICNSSNLATIVNWTATAMGDPVEIELTRQDPSLPYWTVSVEPVDGWRPGRCRGSVHAAVVLGALLAGVLVLGMHVGHKNHMMMLQAMMPDKVVRELSRKQQYNESFDCVTILFSDIVSYTSMASEMSPASLVRLLNELYSLYDSLCFKYGLYKVETIGDAYMCIGGCPTHEDPVQSAVRVARMAQAMVAYTRVLVTDEGHRVRIRVGIHSGPVVAAVLGLKMPRFCCVGDTVNTASRMESNSQSMRIHLSAATAWLLKQSGEDFKLLERGVISVKGKGPMATFWLDPHTPDVPEELQPEADANDDRQAVLDASHHANQLTTASDAMIATGSIIASSRTHGSSHAAAAYVRSSTGGPSYYRTNTTPSLSIRDTPVTVLQPAWASSTGRGRNAHSQCGSEPPPCVGSEAAAMAVAASMEPGGSDLVEGASACSSLQNEPGLLTWQQQQQQAAAFPVAAGPATCEQQHAQYVERSVSGAHPAADQDQGLQQRASRVQLSHMLMARHLSGPGDAPQAPTRLPLAAWKQLIHQGPVSAGSTGGSNGPSVGLSYFQRENSGSTHGPSLPLAPAQQSLSLAMMLDTAGPNFPEALAPGAVQQLHQPGRAPGLPSASDVAPAVAPYPWADDIRLATCSASGPLMVLSGVGSTAAQSSAYISARDPAYSALYGSAFASACGAGIAGSPLLPPSAHAPLVAACGRLPGLASWPATQLPLQQRQQLHPLYHQPSQLPPHTGQLPRLVEEGAQDLGPFVPSPSPATVADYAGSPPRTGVLHEARPMVAGLTLREALTRYIGVDPRQVRSTGAEVPQARAAARAATLELQQQHSHTKQPQQHG